MVGVHLFMIAPFGKYTKVTRVGVSAAARALEKGGTIPSSSGKASVAPTARRNVRRGMAFLKTIATVGFSAGMGSFNFYLPVLALAFVI